MSAASVLSGNLGHVKYQSIKSRNQSKLTGLFRTELEILNIQSEQQRLTKRRQLTTGRSPLGLRGSESFGSSQPKGLVHAIIYNYDNFANNYDNYDNIFYFTGVCKTPRRVTNEVWFSLSSCNNMHLHFRNV